MRSVWVAVTGMMLLTGAAQAAVSINVDKDAQQMTVAVDGVTRYTWPVSSGNPSHETPNGSFRAFRMEEDHYSKEFDDAPMPHAIFFTKRGHAIHGTDSVNRLGSPASHGCVRLSRENASKLWDLVKAEGVLNTTVTLTGSSQVALARNPRTPKTAANSPAVTARTTQPAYDAYGQPLSITPDQTATGESYQRDRTDYGSVNQGRTQEKRRIYVDRATGRRYSMTESEAQAYVNQATTGQGYSNQGYGNQGYANQDYYAQGYSQGYDQNSGSYNRPRYYGPRNGY